MCALGSSLHPENSGHSEDWTKAIDSSGMVMCRRFDFHPCSGAGNIHMIAIDGDHVYVTCTVLPSMRKDRLYDVRVCCTVPANSSVSPHVRAAYCVCPAGLAGSCNHIAALLYALEDFVRLGLREEASKTCTDISRSRPLRWSLREAWKHTRNHARSQDMAVRRGLHAVCPIFLLLFSTSQRSGTWLSIIFFAKVKGANLRRSPYNLKVGSHISTNCMDPRFSDENAPTESVRK